MADLPEEAPNESTLIGAQTVTPFNGSRRLDLHEARALDLRGHGDEEGRADSGPGRLGVPRRSGEDRRAGGGRGRQDADRRRGGEPLRGDDLSRPEGEHGLQRLDDFLGAGAEFARRATGCRTSTTAARTARTSACSGSRRTCWPNGWVRRSVGRHNRVANQPTSNQSPGSPRPRRQRGRWAE